MQTLRKLNPRKTSVTAPVTLGLAQFAAISAVEGLQLTPEGRKRVASEASPEARRAAVINAYLALKSATHAVASK